MAYLKFYKEALVNLEYSLKREFLGSNHSGSYVYTTIAGCNTRKYHGLLVVPIDNFGGTNHVLLSSLDETLIQYDKEFHLGIRQYDEIYDPRGHKYIVDLEIEKNIVTTYRVGGMVLKKAFLFSYNRDQLFIKYTLEDAHSPTKLRIKPFLAFRNIHNLSKANWNINFRYKEIDNGLSMNLYEGFPSLNLQLNKEGEHVINPDWYYNIEYREEKRRGFDSKEDLFVPGYFEVPINKGESIIFSASLSEEESKTFARNFEEQLSKREIRDTFLSVLKNSAKQFINSRNNDTEIYAGYPWLEKNLRDTLISAPGLTVYADGNHQLLEAIIDTFFRKESEILCGYTEQIDVPLWLFWTIQQLMKFSKSPKRVWNKYSKSLKDIIISYTASNRSNISLHENGLLWAEEKDVALSWMDSYVASLPVTERAGYQVETNALWYNAISLSLKMEEKGDYSKFLAETKELIEKNFIKAFWYESEEVMVDYVGHEGQNRLTRPNQIFPCAFDFSPINDEIKSKVLSNVTKELLTVRGIRTLTPKSNLYKPEYEGDQYMRNEAYHQGSTRVWLLGFYIEASLKLYGESFVRKASELISAFEEDMNVHCIGSISELYDGDPPHQPHGCPSFSGSIAEILRSIKLIEQYQNTKI